jgi:hypothetical protein
VYLVDFSLLNMALLLKTLFPFRTTPAAESSGIFTISQWHRDYDIPLFKEFWTWWSPEVSWGFGLTTLLLLPLAWDYSTMNWGILKNTQSDSINVDCNIKRPPKTSAINSVATCLSQVNSQSVWRLINNIPSGSPVLL